MADLRVVELDELTLRPGTYVNPRTEVLVVVDDSPDIDHEIFAGEELDADEWVLISDETPVDEDRRDELIEAFQSRHHGGAAGSIVGDDPGEPDLGPEPDPDPLDEE